jgi:hypothetical protein
MTRSAFGTLDHLISWLKTKRPDETFDAASGINCLFCQYARAYDMGKDYQEAIRHMKLPKHDVDYLVKDPRTFRVAYERAQNLRTMHYLAAAS